MRPTTACGSNCEWGRPPIPALPAPRPPANLPGMRGIGWLILLWGGAVGLVPAAPEPKSVAILYNSGDEESRALAEFYAEARAIPAANLIGLPLPAAEEISRAEYDDKIAIPLRAEFDKRGWWQRRQDAQGKLVPVQNFIRVLVTIRGVPLKIRSEGPGGESTEEDRRKQPFQGHNEASVDSELAMLGLEGYPLDGAMRNPYHRSDKPIAEAAMPGLILTSRIDAVSAQTCRRMITDALAAEKTGLWGFHCIDVAHKYPQGDQWLESIVDQNLAAGLPTQVDRFKPTLPSSYPLRDVAMYYGWYEWHVSGPFLNPVFRFRPGALAIHIHSYSAQQMRDPMKNWSAALLERGAAITVGNVYEPYLPLTHHLDLLHQRLLEGHSWVEAAWMALPSCSWQAVTLGDPLYTPFRHLGGTGEVREEDRAYRALRAARLQWPDKPAERISQLKQAAVRMKSGVLLEAVALEHLEQGEADRAGTCFIQARELYPQAADKLRQDLQRVAILRAAGNRGSAAHSLRELIQHYSGHPEVAAARGWLDIVDPPPPPAPKPPPPGR